MMVSPRPQCPDGPNPANGRPLLDALQDTLDRAYDVITSRPARRTLLNTILLATASTVLYVIAVVAYVLFYRNFLPDQVATVPLHLQYGYAIVERPSP